MRLRRKPYGFRVVDASGGNSVRIELREHGLTLIGDREGIWHATGGPDDVDLKGPSVALVRVRRVDGVLRVSDHTGAPLGRVRAEPQQATAYDAAGTPIAIARHGGGGGRLAVVTRDGAALGFVVGDVTPERAALSFLPAFSTPCRAALLALPAVPAKTEAPPEPG